MEAVEGAALYSSSEVLFGMLTSSDVDEFARQNHFQTELEKVRKLQVRIVGVLNDAENKQMSKPLVKTWLGEANRLMYVVDNMWDDFQALTRTKGRSQSTTSNARSLILTFCTSFVDTALFRLRLRKIITHLKDISAQIDVLGLEKGVEGKVSALEGSSVTPSTLGETIVYGRDEEKEEIVKFLLSYQGIETKVDVISIVGMGGVGKTTLAQLVYNDKRVQEHFDLRSWVCVSNEFDVVRITMPTIYSVPWTNNDMQDLGQVQVELRDALAGKKFLLVLDDVWKEDRRKWDILRSSFEAGAKGSKIIITTRCEFGAVMTGSVHPFRLAVLSEDDCWSLFAEHAFKNQKMDQHPNLEVAQEITYKCKGLPLAAKALGQLLQSEPIRSMGNGIE